MSFDGVSPSEMRTLRGVSPQDLDRLLSGRVPAGGGELDDLTSFFRDLGHAFPQPRVEALEAEHLTAMMAVAEEIRQDQALAPATKQPQQSVTSRHLFALRRKIAVGSAAALSAFSGMAVAGVLPPPIQTAVADTAGNVGIDLPGGSATDEPSEGAEEQPAGSSANEESSSRSEDTSPEGDRRSNPPGSGRKEAQAGADQRGGHSAVPGSDDQGGLDGGRDQDEDAAWEPEDVDDDDDAEEEAADEARERQEDAGDDAEDAEEESAGEDADRAEESAGEAEDSEKEATDEGADNGDAADGTEDAYEDSYEEAETGN